MNLETLKNLIRLGRLGFPFSGFLLFTFGSLWAMRAGAFFDFVRYLFSGIMQISANLSISYSNDYFDVEADKYNQPSPISGGSRILVDHPELRALSRCISLFLIIFSLIFAIVLEIFYDFHGKLIILVTLGNILGWFYSAPPLRLGYRGLSEVVAVFAIGFLLPGTGYFVMKETLDTFFFVISPIFFLYSLAFIISVEIPDLEADLAGGKKTFVTQKGREVSFGIVMILFFLVTLYLTLTQLQLKIVFITSMWPMVLFSLIPLTSGVIGFVKRTENRITACRLAKYNIYSFIFLLISVNLYFGIL